MKSNPKIGKITSFEHKIELSGNFRPKFKEYSVPLNLKEEVEQHLKELEEADIICKAIPTWSPQPSL